MRFLQSFLAENTNLHVLPKPTQPIREPENTNPDKLPKPSKPISVSFGDIWTLETSASIANPNGNEIDRIVNTWCRMFGFTESHQRIGAQIRSLRKWQTKTRRDEPGGNDEERCW